MIKFSAPNLFWYYFAIKEKWPIGNIVQIKLANARKHYSVGVSYLKSDLTLLFLLYILKVLNDLQTGYKTAYNIGKPHEEVC